MSLRTEGPLIVGIGGTPRPASLTERAMMLALEAAKAQGARIKMISGPDLMIPMYTTELTQRTEKSLELVEAIRQCDGIIIASPAYHGSLSGLIKNALDYIEDLRDDKRVYLDGIAVGLIACAGGWQAGVQTLAALRSIVHALRGWPTPLGASLNTTAGIFDAAGNCVDLSTRMQLESVGRQVVEFATMRRAAGSPAPAQA